VNRVGLGATENGIWPYTGDLNLLDTDIDTGSSLWPVLLMEQAPNNLGVLSGVSAISGQGVAAETLVRVGQIDHLVLPNISRVDRNDFLALRLD